MSDYTPIIKKHPKPYLSGLVDDIKARRDKTFFWPSGTQVYCGRQGQGKTISAVWHLYRLSKRYPNAVIVSNLDLTWLTPREFHTKSELAQILNTSREGVEDLKLPILDTATQYIRFSTMSQLSVALVQVNNGFSGVIYLIDEIHTYFNALDSKNIPMFVFTEISQQRKQRKLIIGTSQVFKRMALPFREQCDNIIFCKTYFGIFTTQRVYDGDVSLDIETGMPVVNPNKTGFFIQSRQARNLYDTYQKVVSANEQYENTQVIDYSKQLSTSKPLQKMFGKK